MRNSRSILLLAPQLYGTGGIQAYMRRLWEIVSAYGEKRECPVRCISLVDRRGDRAQHPRPVRHREFSGCEGNKLTFVLRTIAYGMTYRDSLVVVGHIGQAPVAWVLRRLGLIRSYILVLYGIDAWRRVHWLKRQAAGSAAHIVAITWYTAREFCKHNGVALERFRIISPVLAEDQIDQLSRVPQNKSSELRVLTVGRLSIDDRPKGIDTLIEAVGKTRSDGTKINLTVVGDGNDLPRLKELAARLGLEAQVAFLGAVPDERLQQLYQECDVFAMPSKKEGFGIVFLEAMRFEKPCIGGNYGGTPEVITHGVDGYLVDCGDVDQLAHYLVEFSQNSWLRQDMGQKACEKVKSEYLFPHMASKWFSLFEELLGRRT